MAQFDPRRPTVSDHAPPGAPDREEREAEVLLTEAPATVLDDDEEVHDLGFIVEGRDDRDRNLLEPWQRLESIDTDEPLETDPTGPIPEAKKLVREGVPPDWYPVDFSIQNKYAERDEEEFAMENRLSVDPDEEGLTTVAADEVDAGADLDGDQDAETVNILGHAPGIARGFGASVPQDIGAGGFSIRDDPLVTSAPGQRYPISAAPLSDEARGLRDVDEMGREENLDRLADRGARLEEAAAPERPPKRRARR